MEFVCGSTENKKYLIYKYLLKIYPTVNYKKITKSFYIMEFYSNWYFKIFKVTLVEQPSKLHIFQICLLLYVAQSFLLAYR